jgi:RimJ/RimL family protein N-acetyltransferase
VSDVNFLSISTPRLTLRRLNAADLSRLVSYRSMPEVARYQDWDAFGLLDGERLIAEMAQRHPDEPGNWFQFTIVRSEDGLLIGDCGFVSPSGDHRQAEVGIAV